MNFHNYLLSCDWGTTNFRLSLIDKTDEKVIASVKDTAGIALMHNRWQQATSPSSVAFYSTFLRAKIQALTQQVQQKLDRVPIVLSGMASSSIGLVEVPYKKAPFDLFKSDLLFQKIENTTILPNDLYVFGGLQTSEDVMRGEEVQMIGLRNLLPQKGLVLLPGTHSKHIIFEKGVILAFKTFMTGEIFQLLKSYSILKNSVVGILEESLLLTEKSTTHYFEKGVADATKNHFFNALFHVRTNDILRKMPKKDNAAYLSGLVIGSELQTLKSAEKKNIVLAGSNPLFSLYKKALIQLKIETVLIPPPQFKDVLSKAHLHLMQEVANRI